MAAAMNKPKIEQGEEEEANTQIPDDREALLEFMDQRARSIKHLKDQISIFERKVSSSFYHFFLLLLLLCANSVFYYFLIQCPIPLFL